MVKKGLWKEMRYDGINFWIKIFYDFNNIWGKKREDIKNVIEVLFCLGRVGSKEEKRRRDY